jgi:hypothetical protein
VANLQKFDEIRYPDKILSGGMSAYMGLTMLDGSTLTLDHSAAQIPDTPQYWLQLGEIDDLIAAILEIGNHNLRPYLRRSPEAASFVYRENRAFRSNDTC